MSLLFPHGCIVIRYDTTATARWTLPFIFRAFFNDTITVAVWTGFHVRRMHMLPHLSNGRAAMGKWQVLFAGASSLYPESGHFPLPSTCPRWAKSGHPTSSRVCRTHYAYGR